MREWGGEEELTEKYLEATSTEHGDWLDVKRRNWKNKRLSPGFQSDWVTHDATTGRKCSAEGMFLDTNDDWGLGYVD